MVAVHSYNVLIVKEFENSGRQTGSNKPEKRDKVKDGPPARFKVDEHVKSRAHRHSGERRNL